MTEEITCPICKSTNVEVEDNRCDTDLGTFGCVQFFCIDCDKDITEEMNAKEQEKMKEIDDARYNELKNTEMK